MGFFSTISQIGLDAASPFISGSIDRYFGEKSARDNAKVSFAHNQKLMFLQDQLQKQYNKWLIPFQNDQNFNYQMRFLANSPSATVSGLRTAGLNPILAAHGGFNTSSPSGASGGSFGGSSSSVSGSYGKSQAKMDLLGALTASKQLDVLEQQENELRTRSDANTLNAETNRMRAMAEIRNSTRDTEANVKLKSAETALKALEEQRRIKGYNYDSSQLRDVSQAIGHLTDTLDMAEPSVFGDALKHMFYLKSAPLPNKLKHIYDIVKKYMEADTRPTNPMKSSAPSDDARDYWPTRKKKDGKKVFRRTGDIGGILHMIR